MFGFDNWLTRGPHESKVSGWQYYIDPNQFAATDEGFDAAFTEGVDHFHDSEEVAVTVAKQVSKLVKGPVVIETWPVDEHGERYGLGADGSFQVEIKV